MKSVRKYVKPKVKTKQIKANFFFSFDKVGDSLLGFCITGGGYTCNCTGGYCGGATNCCTNS